MNRDSARIVFLQAMTVLLVALSLLAAAAFIWQKHVRAEAQLSELEPRFARVQGLRAMQPELEKAAKSAQAALQKHAYPAELDATKAGNDAQQRIRTVFEASQLNIASIQVQEVKDSKEGEGFQRINVVLQAEGTLSNIRDAGLRLKDQTPTILIDSMTLQNMSPARPASVQRLSANFSFSVLRARPGP